MTREEFSQKLVKIKNQFGIKQMEIIWNAKFSPSQYVRISKGSNNYSVELALRYCKAVNCNIVMGFGGKQYVVSEYSDIPIILRNVRAETMSLAKLGEQVGCSKQSIHNMEKNHTVLHIDLFLKICEALNINIEIR